MPISFFYLGCCHSLEENISNTIFEELIGNMFTSLGNMLFAFILIPATLRSIGPGRVRFGII